jgi:hypothetical protein
MKSKPTTPIPVRISDQALKELKRIGVEQDRAVGWLIRFACDFLVNAYRMDPNVVRPASAQTQQVPAPVVTAQSEDEMLKARIAELEAKLDLRAAVVRYDLPPSGRSTPKGAKQAAAVPPTSISKHSVKH